MTEEIPLDVFWPLVLALLAVALIQNFTLEDRPLFPRIPRAQLGNMLSNAQNTP